VIREQLARDEAKGRTFRGRYLTEWTCVDFAIALA